MKQFFFLAILSLFLGACNVEPQPINYGSDACHYCDMTIVDKQHASQLVTSKGKAYTYDAIECMVHSLQDEFKDTEMAYYLVADFNEPGELVSAEKATYLVSELLQSPMGENLSAFLKEEDAKKAQEKFKGSMYSWKDIQEHLKIIK
ncbi:nitrous oxide reductase accessory protein NosL [Gelidibacter mesophilus]|uniref:nitrous oxide reductase accessory protein NosL n=1 Tax=Gelidibacter mesophilus TaxID=169050 RepID=UPI00047F7F1F|nr:nitrous oxide reductase accessory protein NosL [Gelidibacter mesophilus]